MFGRETTQHASHCDGNKQQINNKFYSQLAETVERHVIELKSIAEISSMDPFKSCQRWCRTLLNRRGALTKPPFCDSPLTGCELTMVSALYLLEFDSFAVNDCKRDNKTCNLLRQSISFKLFFCFAKHLKQIKKFPSNSFLFISFLQAEFSYSRFIFVFRHTVLGRNEACDSRSRWIWKTIWVWCSDGMSRLVLFFFLL